jgi:branched-chain amino acid transport system substrate-binding protein
MSSARVGLLIPRRTALFGAAALPLAAPFVARAADPIKIGVLLAKTGQIAGQTEYLANGTFLAMEQRNNMIMGQPAELVWLDEPSPQAATQNMQKLVQENKCVAILGGSLSSNALAEEATAAQLKIPFVCDNAAATEISGKNCNRFTFRLNTPVAVQSRMLAPYALSYGKKWYHITAEVGSDEVPLNTADFSSFILKIRQAKPDVVVGGLSGGDLSTFLKQWNELGMKGKIPFAEIAIGDTDIWAVGPDAATGTFTKMWEHTNPNNTAEEKAFAASYLKKYGKPAADKAWMGWITARSVFESIDAAKSTDAMTIVEALEAWKAPAGDTSYQYRKFDHQMLARNLAVTVKDKITDKWDYFDVKATLPKDAADVPAVFGTEADIGCKMG